MKASRPNWNGTIIAVETFGAQAIVRVVGVISARGAVLAGRQDARVVQLATRAVVARMAQTFESRRFERYLTLPRHARIVQQTLYII